LNQLAMSSKLSPLIDAASVAVVGSPLTNVLPPLDASGHWVRVGLAVQEQPHDRVGANLRLLLGDVSGLGHAAARRVANDVDAAAWERGRFAVQYIDHGPAPVCAVLQARLRQPSARGMPATTSAGGR
jgi:hypothetical protein